MSNVVVEVYSANFHCEYCEAAKELLDSENIRYKEYIVGVDIDRDAFLEKFNGIRTVPQIMLNGKHVGGFIELKEHLENEA